MATDPEIEFAEGEVAALDAIRGHLNRIAEWPPESPLSFVLSLAPRTRGKLGEMLLAQIASRAGMTIDRADSVAYDVKVGSLRFEVKFSTEDPPRFQQVRDPRGSGDSFNYDYLVGISGRPHGLAYWLIPAGGLADLITKGEVPVQHALSTTRWFLHSRTESDAFSAFRYLYEDLVVALRNASA